MDRDPPPAAPPDDAFVDLRPVRWKARLAFWLAFSVILHAAAGIVIWRSQSVRDFLFSSFRDKPRSIEDVAELSRSRAVFDHLTRKRLAETHKRMLITSKTCQEKRDREWAGVVERAAANPNFKAMADGGLPAIDLIAAPGDPARDGILACYERSRRIEAQVFSLYEQYKAVNLSLISVKGMQGGQPVPQALSDSLDLVRLERPGRPDLDRELLEATDEQLFAMKATPGRPAVEDRPAEPGLPDGYQRWRAEAMRALELSEIMANNCQRILENVAGFALTADGGPASLAPGGGGEAWSEDNPYRGESLRPQDAAPADLTSTDMDPVLTFGKHLGKPDERSRPAKYLVVDTWWSIGPFEYIGGIRTSESLHHKYPPENGVDLDATYLGKNGRKLRWEYHPMSKVRQEPRHVGTRSLYYFYTEFWSETEGDVWANVASDDFGALWLNPTPSAPDPVYTSGEDPRPWVILDARQFVKLKVRKGTNRLLMKLDNNGGTTGFSVILCLK